MITYNNLLFGRPSKDPDHHIVPQTQLEGLLSGQHQKLFPWQCQEVQREGKKTFLLMGREGFIKTVKCHKHVLISKGCLFIIFFIVNVISLVPHQRFLRIDFPFFQ